MNIFVLHLFPAMAQMSIYFIAGDPDDGDRMLMYENEIERKTRIDITPITRHLPWYVGGRTNKRRQYIQFGKQAWEVYQGWMLDFTRTFGGKLSAPAALVCELMLGGRPGSDWSYEFEGMGMAGLFYAYDADGRPSFFKSRAGYTVQKMMPMALSSMISDPESLPAALFAPAAKGMSQGKAVDYLTSALKTLADRDTWGKWHASPDPRKAAHQHVSEILHALEVNGYDPKETLATAKAAVLSPLYLQFWGAMGDKDVDKMNALAAAILRVGGTVDGAIKSINRRYGLANKQVSPEEEAAIKAAFAAAVPPTRR